MLILSDDRLTIIDTGNGPSFTAEDPIPSLKNGYTIFANFKTGWKRVLIKDINRETAIFIMQRIFDELTRESEGMMIHHPKPYGDVVTPKESEI